MLLGEPVYGLMMNHHWRFVVSDAHNVAEAVQRHDSRARLVAHDEDARIAVARWIDREALGEDIEEDAGVPVNDRGGAYLLVFYPRRDGKPMVGEPDMTVLDQMRERDVHARARPVSERQIFNELEKAHAVREAAAAEQLMERAREQTEVMLHRWAQRQHVPWRTSRIYVPRGVTRGRG